MIFVTETVTMMLTYPRPFNRSQAEQPIVEGMISTQPTEVSLVTIIPHSAQFTLQLPCLAAKLDWLLLVPKALTN